MHLYCSASDQSCMRIAISTPIRFQSEELSQLDARAASTFQEKWSSTRLKAQGFAGLDMSRTLGDKVLGCCLMCRRFSGCAFS